MLEPQLNSLFLADNSLGELDNIEFQFGIGVDRKNDIDRTNFPEFITADKVPPWDRLRTRCETIDTALSGGIPFNGITEVYGCSGVGKTQLGLQLALSIQLPETLEGKNRGAAYICTEDVFPSKRFHQLASSFKQKYNIEFEDNMHIKHVSDYKELNRTLHLELPMLVKQRNIGLIVIDSIAGVFRYENDAAYYHHRRQDVHSIVRALHRLSNNYNMAIICINQVTQDVTKDQIEPCLGLRWSNYLTYRCCISRYNNNPLREFEVIFAPDLPRNCCSFVINEDGISAAD